ncbi:sialate O-acetylesterase [Bermanella sp. R86510]|uniref:sialate O-acetylesterase n=1 Tax=unclassified Bermanella TaxID=2627862 RepID=UPI0037C9F75C
MSNYFQLISDLDELIRQFQAIVSGGESDLVLTDHGYKPSIQKAIFDNLEYLQTLVQGGLAFETYAQMKLDDTQSIDTLARVWNDPKVDLNGLYGWNGVDWIRSPMDSVSNVNSKLKYLPEQSASVALKNIYEDGLESYIPSNLDAVIPIVKDLNDNVLIGIDGLGRINFDMNPSSAIKSLSRIAGPELSQVDESESDGLAFAVVDNEQKIALAVSSKGDLIFNKAADNFGLNQFNLPILHHLIMDGQSQASGQAAIPQLTELSDGRYNWPLMPDGGVNDYDFSTVIPLAENNYETPCAGFALGALDRIQAPQGVFNWRIGVSNSGVGGTQIRLFSKGQSQYFRFFAHIQSMVKSADSISMGYEVHGYAWLQGGTDMNNGTTYSDYKNDLIALRFDRQEELKTILQNTSVDLHCFTWQNGARNWVNNIDVPNAQRDAANEDDRIHLVCPSYFFEFVDSVHLTNISSKWIGMYMGQAYRKVVLEGKKVFPLQPDSVDYSNQELNIQFSVPHPPLEFDTDLLVDVGDQGFIVTDDLGDVGISAISIHEGVRVQLQLGRPLSSGGKVSYGRKFTGSGSAESGDHCRGHLRDSAGYTNVYKATEDGHYRDLPLHNWCVIFELSVS